MSASTAIQEKPVTDVSKLKSAADVLRDSGETEFGSNLPANKPMVLYSWSANTQVPFPASQGREARVGTLINLRLAHVETPDQIEDFHCYSEVLRRQLAKLGDNLPIRAQFVQKEANPGLSDAEAPKDPRTGNRYMVWTIQI